MTETINHSNTDKAKSATFNSGLPDLNQAKPARKPLKYLLGCRVKLSELDRQKLKDAYRALRDAATPQAGKTPGSTVSSTTQFNLDRQLGMGSIVMSDLLGTRESIPLTTILKLQKVLNVEVVSREDLEDAAESYINYVLEHCTDE